MIKVTIFIILLVNVYLIKCNTPPPNAQYINLSPNGGTCFNSSTTQFMGYSMMIRGDGTACLNNEVEDMSYLFTPYFDSGTYILDTYEYQTCNDTLVSSGKIQKDSCVYIPQSFANSFYFTIDSQPNILDESVVVYDPNHYGCNHNVLTYYSNKFNDDNDQIEYLCIEQNGVYQPYFYQCEEGICKNRPLECSSCYGF
ncbi:hypothetical protein DLAC_10790 [Tieghemostelium lacteum]|uniref:Uncharacterized protein n=1 Tax=Tieghemostelium lacteum TaxID=361077 RepID=A0A151Z4B5_TIELA|nr:hypothetical protein DLAC_10790 [Tieghemostelium lacteum]|eukprot:KYQ88757.1 hypothetical protein DLAC_10790 [Tieghemostelium lacteum]